MVDHLKQGFGLRSSVRCSVLQVSILFAAIAILFNFQISFNGNYHLEVLRTFYFRFQTISKGYLKALIIFKIILEMLVNTKKHHWFVKGNFHNFKVIFFPKFYYYYCFKGIILIQELLGTNLTENTLDFIKNTCNT